MDAVVHDYLDNIGGGEKLMLALARELDADFVTLDYNREVVSEMGYEDVKVVDLGSTVKLPPLKQVYASLKYALADLKGYDRFVFSGNWSHYAANKHHPNIWYCHTPVRAFYTDRKRIRAGMNPVKKPIYDLWVRLHTRWDKSSVKNIDVVVANSENTRERIKRTYGLDAKVVYPGIDTERYRYEHTGDYWLSVNRLYPEKRVHLQVEAFKKMPEEKLVIVGGSLPGDHSSNYVQQLLKDLPDNIEYRGRVSENELIGLYASCKGFIATASDEDFGMTPVEAMASEKPVIATREGGFLESMVDGVTGRLIAAEKDELMEAVEEVGSRPGSYRSACRKKARQYDLKVFTDKMREVLEGL